MFGSNINENLMKAVNKEDVRKVKTLLASGASANVPIKGQSLLHLTRNVEITKHLLLNGAEVNRRDAYTGATPLIVAVCGRKVLNLIKVLIRHGADVNAKGQHGYTSLHHAVYREDWRQLIRVLLENGADVNAVREDHATPLYLAVSTSGWAEKIKVLLEYGADINARNKEGDTLLHRAIRSTKSMDLIKTLLQFGANIDATNDVGNTPLNTVMSVEPDVEVVRILLHHGANINTVNINGDTPLNTVVLYDPDIEIIKILLHKGADISTVNKDGDTPTRRILKSFAQREICGIGNSINDLDCAMLVIKEALLKNFDKHYRPIIDDLETYDYFMFTLLSNNVDGYINEIRQMKTDIVIHTLSLYDIVNSVNVNMLDISDIMPDEVILTNYPLYYDVISLKLKWYRERVGALKKLNQFPLYSSTDIHNPEKKVILNFDATYIIAEYLSNDDLSNLTTALTKSVRHSSGSIVGLRRKVHFDESCSSKRARVEKLKCGIVWKQEPAE